MRGEERDRLVAPVVREAGRRILRIVLEDGEQLDGRHAEVREIGNLLDETRVRAASRRRDARARVPREPADMQLVDDRVGERSAGRAIVFPVVPVPSGHHALHGGRQVAARPHGRRPIVGARHFHCAPVRIQQQLVAVEPQPAIRRERPYRPEAVELARSDAWHERTPVVIGPVRLGIQGDDVRRLLRVGVVEQEQLDARRISGKHAEVHAAVADGGPEGRTRARRRDLERAHNTGVIGCLMRRG
jgi:hypothetical protein